jgi:acetolactate synthase-1/2/3 large subunit
VVIDDIRSAKTGAAGIAEVVADAGITLAFGLTGGDAGLVFDELHRQGRVRFILVRHEQAATIMADVYGRLTGLPGVAVAQGVFMASSGAFGLMESALSSSPVLAITDTSVSPGFAQYPSYQAGTGDYGTTDLPQIFRGMTKYFAYATTPKEAVHATQLGIKHALADRPGLAVVLARASALGGTVDEGSAPVLRPTAGYLARYPRPADPDAVATATNAIARASRPVIIAGNGVHVARAYGELRELAHRLGAPVTTSAKGLSAISGRDDLAYGLMGTFGTDNANRAVAEADLVIVVGTKLSTGTTRSHNPALLDPERQVLVHVDIDARNVGWALPARYPLLGDARVVLRQLLRALDGELGPETRTPWFVPTTPIPASSPDSDLPSPRRIVQVLGDTLPPQTMITLDAGKNRLYTMHAYRAGEPGTIIVPGGIAGMGWAAPAAVAAKLIRPDRPALAIAGDGGFSMTSHAVATAVQHNVPALFLVMNDSALGWSRDTRKEMPHVAELSPIDFVMLARSYGADGVRVENAAGLAKAIECGLRSTKPFVIDVATSREPSFYEIYNP